MSDTLSPAPEQSREQEPWPSVDTSHLANGRVSVLIRRLLMGSAAVVAMAGCASGSRVSSLSQPSADPTVYAVTGSPTGPVFPEPVSTTTTIWSPPPAATSAVGCQSGVVAIANVWYASDSYLCLHIGSRVNVTLFNYPSGWSPLLIDPAGAAKVSALKTNADGSQAAAITVTKTGTFTASTDSLDNLAPSEDWTLHVTVRQ
jgi:hypothetical protein